MKKIILASASPRRRELLETAGIPFSVCPSKAEENITTSEPGRAVEELSEQKCREVFERTEGDVLVIGADTVVSVAIWRAMERLFYSYDSMHKRINQTLYYIHLIFL